MLTNKWLNPFFLIFLFLADIHLSNLLNQFVDGQFRIISHLFLLVLVYQVRSDKSSLLYWIYALVGFFVDAYYFGTVGLTSFLLPCIIFCLRKIPKFRELSPFYTFLVTLLVNFTFDILLYGLAYVYQLTSYSLPDFIAFSLAPSLLYNSFVSLLIVFYISSRKE